MSNLEEEWKALKDQRGSNGELTPLACALDALANFGCDCGQDEPGTCLSCLCEAALKSVYATGRASVSLLDRVAAEAIEKRLAERDERIKKLNELAYVEGCPYHGHTWKAECATVALSRKKLGVQLAEEVALRKKLEARLAEKDGQIAERDGQIESLLSTVAQRTARIAELGATLSRGVCDPPKRCSTCESFCTGNRGAHYCKKKSPAWPLCAKSDEPCGWWSDPYEAVPSEVRR